MAETPMVKVVNFESRKIYQSSRHPGYTSWVSFFPGERGQWYLGCEEVWKPETPLPTCDPERWHTMVLPDGYDKSGLAMEAVILESTDQMRTWQVISRWPAHMQHTVGQFGTARTRDGRFLRFVWACYNLDPSPAPNEILFESADNGKTWQQRPAFHDPRFFSYPHRLRTLRDGTLVLAIPFGSAWWGPHRQKPNRIAVNLNADTNEQMTLYFSADQGKTWTGPVTIYGGQTVSETDFVELPTGDLLCINNSIFANPGRQIVYRTQQGWVPGPFERVRAGRVPETVALTEDGILVGCMRCSSYHWSDDLGQTWQPLEGMPDKAPENYQPWIHYLGNNKFACAGHYGYDDAFGSRDQYISLHLFEIQHLGRTRDTHIDVRRDFYDAAKKWLNRYTLTLTCDSKPLPDKELDFWVVERDKPGYDSFNSKPIDTRMQLGGKLIKLKTDSHGIATVALPEFDVKDDRWGIHHCYQFVARFNWTRQDPEYKPFQTHLFEFYSNSSLPTHI